MLILTSISLTTGCGVRLASSDEDDADVSDPGERAGEGECAGSLVAVTMVVVVVEVVVEVSEGGGGLEVGSTWYRHMR
jgi:hypothetical protein